MYWDFELGHFQKSKMEKIRPPAPVLLRDLYFEFFVPRMLERLENWDSLSEDKWYTDKTEIDKGWHFPMDDHKWETEAYMSEANCRKACEKTKECFQYIFFHDKRCRLGNAFCMGHPLDPNETDEGRRQTSGWLTDRIKTWVTKQGSCGKVLWPEV